MRLDAQRWQLENGAVFLFSEKRDGAGVAFVGSAPLGSAREPTELTGVAHFTAALLNRGTDEKTRQQIAEELESVGASLGFSAGAEALIFSAVCLPEQAPLVLRNAADCLERAVFPEEEVEKARGEILTALRQREDDPRAMSEEKLRQIVYPAGHPYSRTPLGTKETVERIGRQEIIAFRDSVYSAQGMIIAVAGDIDPAEALDAVRATLGAWEKSSGAAAMHIPDPQDIAGGTHAVPMMHKAQADLSMGLPALRRTDDDFYALDIANLILGRLGLMGRLGRRVRDDQGLAYYATSILERTRGRGLWMAKAGVNPADVERALEAIISEVRRLREDGLEAGELDDARTHLVGSLVLRLETNQGIAGALHEIEYYSLGIDFFDRYAGILRQVTAEKMAEAVGEYLDCDRMTTVVAGPWAG
jgi:zinc protease